jgi:hypothetical protein
LPATTWARRSRATCTALPTATASFIVARVRSEPFQVNGRRGEPNEAVHKAAAKGEPVTQEIAVSVKGDKVECAINGTVVGSYDKATLVTAGS